MNIAVIELGDSHAENIYTLIHFIKLKGHRAYLILNKGLSPLVKEHERIDGIFEVADNIVKTKRQIETYKKVAAFLKEEKIDSIIFGTMEAKPVRNLLPFLKGYNIIGLVHDAQKIDKSHTFKWIYPFWIKKYIVFGNFIKNEIKKHDPKNLHSFFPVYFPKPEACAITKPEGEKWIIIPGSVSLVRKDYSKLLTLLAQHILPQNCQLVLLGKLNKNDTDLNRLISAAEERGNRIKTFSDYLDYDLFHTYLTLADVMLPLLKIEDDITYRNSRVSGAFHLAYAYRLPLLLPSSYKINTDLANYSIYYNTIKDLYDLITDSCKSDSFAQNIRSKYSGAVMFDYEKRASDFMEFAK